MFRSISNSACGENEPDINSDSTLEKLVSAMASNFDIDCDIVGVTQ